MSVILLVAYVTFAVWIYLLFLRGGYWKTRCRDEIAVAPLDAWPSVCVIIPARNEADMLERTLPTLLQNDYPLPLHVVLVDDRSEDGTSDVALRVAEKCRSADRMTLVKGYTLPGHWVGKVQAMQCGLEQSAKDNPPDYILFTDADIAYGKGVITRLVTRAQKNRLVLTSLMAHLRCKSLAERLLIPAFVYFFQMLYPFAWVNNSQRTIAAAAGGCMLVRYDALCKAGGLAPIRSALIDDCALARLLKKQGPIWLGLTEEVHSLRPYPAINDIRAMVSRSAYNQLGYSAINLILAILGLVITYIAPVMLALFTTGTPRLLGIASWIAMSLTFIPMLRLYHRSLWLSMTLPMVAVIYILFTLESAIQHWCGKGGLWKGRIQSTPARGL